MINLARTIRIHRQDAGLTQAALADRVGVESTYLSALERGKKEPSLSLLRRLASALRTPLEVIFWESVELGPRLKPSDRRIIEMAKVLAKHYA